MIDRALVRNGAVIRKYSGEKGWVILEGGGKVSPPVLGYTNGNDNIVPVVEETNDTSTGSDIVTTRVETVEADRVLVVTTIRDMTAQELDEDKTNRAVSEADMVLGEIQRRAMNLLFSLAKVNTPSLTVQQFLNAFEGSMGDEPITRQMFINYIADKRL